LREVVAIVVRLFGNDHDSMPRMETAILGIVVEAEIAQLFGCPRTGRKER
jgi:hypothetical protein